jgi:hypothetical protein
VLLCPLPSRFSFTGSNSLREFRSDVETIVKATHPNLLSNYQEPKFLEEGAILCPRNETVEEINEYIMS